MKKILTKSYGYTLAQLNRIWNQQFIAILQHHGYYNLKPSFCVVFFPLFENNGQTAANLAKAAHITKQTMSIYIQELRQRGYIKLVKDKSDRRAQCIFLTAKGATLQKIFEESIDTLNNAVFANLTRTERKTLGLLIEKCIDKTE